MCDRFILGIKNRISHFSTIFLVTKRYFVIAADSLLLVITADSSLLVITSVSSLLDGVKHYDRASTAALLLNTY